MDLNRRFRVALMVYAVLAIAIWFSMSGQTVHLGGIGWVSFRLVALIVLGLFAVKTFLRWKAEQIRDRRDEEAGRKPLLLQS